MTRWGRSSKPYRIWGEGPAQGPRSELLEAWSVACKAEQEARDSGHWLRQAMAAVARIACEEALNSARRN